MAKQAIWGHGTQYHSRREVTKKEALKGGVTKSLVTTFPYFSVLPKDRHHVCFCVAAAGDF